MGRAKFLPKKTPLTVTSTKDVVESSESHHVPVQRKRGRPRKVLKAELPAEEMKSEEQSKLTESGNLGKTRKWPKMSGEQVESVPESNGAISEEEAPKRRKGSRRKSEPRRAAGACIDTL